LKIFASVGELTASVSVPDLVDAGYLAKPRFQFLKPAPVSIKKNAPWARVYKEGIVANPYRNAAIVEKAFELLNDGRQVYIHVIQIAHGKYLANQIPGSVFVSGSSKDRREQIARFKNGELRCMISTLLKEGVNIPGIDALIYAAGYKSGVMTIQTIGRCLRVAPGKKMQSSWISSTAGTGTYPTTRSNGNGLTRMSLESISRTNCEGNDD
jgi:superfamily II DNA or RNA helicase